MLTDVPEQVPDDGPEAVLHPGSDEVTVRPATPDDAWTSARLSQEAFGAPEILPQQPADPSAAHKTTYLAQLGGRVVGKASDRPFESWYGGRRVSTSGLASVVVQPEARGRGVARTLLADVLARAHARGAVISTLYATAPGIYRGLGFGYAGAYTWVAVPTAALAAVRPPAHDVRLERADSAAWPDMLACYTSWAREHDGPLSRADAGYPAPPAELDSHAVTLARATDGALAGEVVGFAVWRRTSGHLADGELVVPVLVATSADAARALLRSLGSHASAAPHAKIQGAGEDLLPWLLPTKNFPVVDWRPYLLAVLDVAGAVAARGWAPGVAVGVTVEVAGLPVPGQDGTYRIEVADGRAGVERLDAVPARGPAEGGRAGAARITAQGLGMLYAGCPAARLRLAGHLTGSEASMPQLDALALAAAGRPFAIRDYF